MITYDTPIRFEIGLDGLPYAVLPNEFEAEDYAENGEELACFGGYYNAVLLQPTIGM